MPNNLIVTQVRELFDRKLCAKQISHRLHIGIEDVLYIMASLGKTAPLV